MCLCWLFKTSWLSLETCCGCLDTAQGTVLTALLSIVACVATFTFNVLCMLNWIHFTHAVHQQHNSTDISYDVVEYSLKLLYWGNIFILIFVTVFIILCVMVIIGVQKRLSNYLIPWISLSTMVIPVFAMSNLFLLIMGIIGDELRVILIPALLFFVLSCVWAYGLCCVMSHYKMLKGNRRLQVTTLFKEEAALSTTTKAVIKK